jgi:glutamate-ammonia-ligase adenylyltransferase
MIMISTDGLPRANDAAAVRRGEERWREKARNSADSQIIRFADESLASDDWGALLRSVFAHSPYLTQSLIAEIDFVRSIAERGWRGAFDDVLAAGEMLPTDSMQTAPVMSSLRKIKRRSALLIALADIAGAWPLETVTGALTQTAEMSLRQAIRHLLATPAFARLPPDGGGLLVLGMGKLGARELNYSSDIDLVIFYDDNRFAAESGEAGPLFVRLARALVRVMDERTGDGYIFRTDLRLRPDPGSTPLAVSLSAAEFYYGSVGQNWERAAMIKARQVAGDPDAGAALFDFLKPWIWRRNLDFAAIEDIQSIKRQINQHRVKPTGAALMGHNIKLGQGGIREIEFFVQTQQLIFGGRDARLRTPSTCDGLYALAAANRIDTECADTLAAAYRFLRKVEHRLQMVDDQQTHSLPVSEDGMARIAGFMGFPDRESFTEALATHLNRVQERFAALFGRGQSLSGPGNLVFTGVENDPDTIKTLTGLGFANAQAVAATIRGWHHGRYRATRSERARELLTKLTPDLLEAFAKTAEPDAAFLRFDAFLSALPAGVMLLALLSENRQFLGLLGRIMGMAPALAEQLSKNPALFDELLTADFFAGLPEPAFLQDDLDQTLALSRDYEEALIRLRRWAAGRRFQAGVHILDQRSDGVKAGRFLAEIAEIALARLLPLVEAEFATRHGRIPGGGFAIVAFGRLGGRLMSFSSDLDLVTIYDAPAAAMSDGAKPLDSASYYIRLTQRLIAAISAPMAEGRLYPVDMRLRPSGEAGPAAARLDAFRNYHATSAWTWERMALTRARVVAGPATLARDIDAIIRYTLTKRRDPSTLLADVADMRRRIAEQHPPRNRWHLKYVRGGLIDIEFIVQYMLLRHAPESPALLTTETAAAIDRLKAAGYLAGDAAADLRRALGLAWDVQGLIRLTTDAALDPRQAPAAMKAMLAAEVARATGMSAGLMIDFEAAETILDDILASSLRRFDEIIGRRHDKAVS